jgi:hypothetical protein
MKLRCLHLATAACTAVVAATFGLATTAAYAYTTSTPSGGPDVDFIGSGISFNDAAAGQIVGCSQFEMAGSVTNPGVSRIYGQVTAKLDTFTVSGCTPGTVSSIGPWTFAITGDPTGASWPAELADVAASITLTGCTFNIGGTVTGTFDTGLQTFTPSNGSLLITNVPSGIFCPLLGVAAGDPITVSGSWTNSPPAGSTPLTFTNP